MNGNEKVKQQRGFSLVEIMVASFLSMIIIGVAISGYIQYRRSMESQRVISDLNSNLRTASRYLTRDVGMAGYGLNMQGSQLARWLSWVSGFNENPRIIDAASGPDEIQIAAAFEPVGTLRTTAENGYQISLQNGQAGSLNTSDRSVIYIGNCELARVTGIAGDTLTISTHESLNNSLMYTHLNGSLVELVQIISYSVEHNPDWADFEYYLKRDDGRPESQTWFENMVAAGIEDLQFSRDGNMVNVEIHGRSSQEDLAHTDPVHGDHYRRAVLEESVFLRNEP